MKLLHSALVSTVWVTALLAAAASVQAHYLAEWASGSDVRDEGVIYHGDKVSPPRHKTHVHGPPRWPYVQDFSGSGMAVPTDGSAGVVIAGQTGNPPSMPNDQHNTGHDQVADENHG
ncbi:hypothetical protein JM18_009409, partial [Phytophthora kernoviae]